MAPDFTDGRPVLLAVPLQNSPGPDASDLPATNAEDATMEVEGSLETQEDVPQQERKFSWTTNQAKFLISTYKGLNEKLGSRTYKRKKEMWQKVAEAINKEFLTKLTPLQVENKWKSLERSYQKAKTKNATSGHNRVDCEFEK